MIKLIITALVFFAIPVSEVPEVKVSGAMRNIMVNGDLSSQASLDTINKDHLYGLGPVAGLKGEMMILDGVVYSSSSDGGQVTNQQDKVSQAAMLVYSKVEKWKTINIKTAVNSYAELERLVENTAKANGYDVETPFVFKIEGDPSMASYHVIDWKEGIGHTMDNHKQFAYAGQFINEKAILLGFYSRYHQGIFTHHTTYMHVHISALKTKTIGHLDDIRVNNSITIYLPEK